MPISGEPPTQNGMVHVDALRGGNYRAFFCMVVFWGCVRGRVVIFRDPILEHRGELSPNFGDGRDQAAAA